MEKIVEQAVAVIGMEKYTSNVVSAGHELLADEPMELGGADKGMNPFSLLAASLATCTTSTLRMYADRKQWPLEGVEVKVTLKRNEAFQGMLIDKEVHLKGILSPEQKARLLDIAEKCPVQKVLTGEIKVNTVAF